MREPEHHLLALIAVQWAPDRSALLAGLGRARDGTRTREGSRGRQNGEGVRKHPQIRTEFGWRRNSSKQR
eukprot:11639709-Alexandrium_andersonii.AAC.1